MWLIDQLWNSQSPILLKWFLDRKTVFSERYFLWLIIYKFLYLISNLYKLDWKWNPNYKHIKSRCCTHNWHKHRKEVVVVIFILLKKGKKEASIIHHRASKRKFRPFICNINSPRIRLVVETIAEANWDWKGTPLEIVMEKLAAN